MKKIFMWIVVLLLIGVGVFWYVTRPVVVTDVISSVPENELEQPWGGELYRIDGTKSEVVFTIDEELRGSPFTVIGKTNAVSGDISITESGEIVVGTITIDARTFKTDSSNRDAAINRAIVKTETAGNEVVIFTAKEVVGAPSAIENGTEFTFSVRGDLTLAGITKPATLSVTAVRTDDSFSGTITAPLKRSDYNLVIPSIPFVANVPDTFTGSAMFYAPIVK